MSSRGAVFSLVSCLLSSSVVVAGDVGPAGGGSRAFRPVVSLFGGVAGVNAGRSQTFLGTDGDVFVYNNQSNNKITGFVGGFLGVEHELLNQALFMQGGVEYNWFVPAKVNGLHSVGNEPATSTLYNYDYDFQPQQVLAVAKLLTTTHRIFHPYVSVGLGAAFNQASQFKASTQESGSVNLTPTFDAGTQTAFSYSLGLGVDTNVNQHVRIGLGYRFTGFGSASLGQGNVEFNNYVFPTSFTLGVPNAYANQFVAQISFLS